MKKHQEDLQMLYDILMSDDVSLSILKHEDELFEIIPELMYIKGFEHKHPHHHLDVYSHTILALSLSEKNFSVRLSLLLHDIGKPFSFTEYKNVRHFKNHPYFSSVIARKILKRLSYDDEFIEKICYLIKMHDSPITFYDVNSNYDLSYELYLVQRCDALAHNPKKLEKRIKYLDESQELFAMKK